MALSLALAMGLSLVACGKDKEEKKDETTAATTEATEDDTTEEADTTEATDTDSDVAITVPSADGEAIHVYSWNEELGSRIEQAKSTRPAFRTQSMLMMTTYLQSLQQIMM